ncbi:hypothetical protein SFR_6746 [Streptomyces sp. FR-008]|nr:hypothetical protein SFR_6746 [Streptomyces sp. FR-008]
MCSRGSGVSFSTPHRGREGYATPRRWRYLRSHGQPNDAIRSRPGVPLPRRENRRSGPSPSPGRAHPGTSRAAQCAPGGRGLPAVSHARPGGACTRPGQPGEPPAAAGVPMDR